MISRAKTFIHSHEKDILLAIFIALIATISFALGYLTVNEKTKAEIVIEKN
jgi:hypothetical protein